MMLQQYFGEMKSTDFAWCRLFYMYGEHEDQRRLVPYLRNCLENGIPAELSDGNQIRDYMDVSDVGFKIAKVAVEAFYGPMNICSGMPRTIRDLAFEIADNYGRRDLLRFSTRTKLTNDPLRVVGEPSI
jgi:dTDP-6-deoxy-L-talose 4-dehydrogenase (NAD+)